MTFYRLIKPLWAKPLLENGNPNPKFKEEFEGPNTIEGLDFPAEKLKELNDRGYSVYFFPNHPAKDVYAGGVVSIGGSHIDVFNYVFVDMDLKDGIYETKEAFLEKLKSFPLATTLVVDSGHGIHAYWAISDLTRDKFVITQLALIQYFKTDASIWTCPRLMRVPGYQNTKVYKEWVPAQVIPEYTTGEVYEFEQIPKDIYELPLEVVQKGKAYLDKLDGKQVMAFREDVDLSVIPPRFLELTKRAGVMALWKPEEGVDKSAADMELANILFSENFNFNEALAILANTQKALEKGEHRLAYARLGAEKVYGDRECKVFAWEKGEDPSYIFETVTQFVSRQENQIKEEPINGPAYLDYKVLGEPWRKKELLSIIAGPGMGKTAFAMNIIREIIRNNPDQDDVYVFFSLEMTRRQVISRWLDLTGEDPHLANRLYVVDTQDSTGMPINIGLQEIYSYCTELKKRTGRNIGAIVLDHFHIISSHIDTRRSPTFGITAEQGTGYGVLRNLSLNGMASQLKGLVKVLDTFGIILTQTTKEKGVGDLPIGKDGGFGVSQLEWICDRILTLWQPLMRVQHLTPLRFLAFQYAKIREKRENDKIREYEQKLLTYEPKTGLLRPTFQKEWDTFNTLLPTVQEIRENLKNKKGGNYSILADFEEIETLVRKKQ